MIDRFPTFPKRKRRAKTAKVPVVASYPSPPLEMSYPSVYSRPTSLQSTSKGKIPDRHHDSPTTVAQGLPELDSKPTSIRQFAEMVKQNSGEGSSRSRSSTVPVDDTDASSISVSSLYSQDMSSDVLRGRNFMPATPDDVSPISPTRTSSAARSTLDADCEDTPPVREGLSQLYRRDSLCKWLNDTAPKGRPKRHNVNRLHHLNRDGIKHIMREEADVLIEYVDGIALTTMWSSLHQRDPERQEIIPEIEAEDLPEIIVPRVPRLWQDDREKARGDHSTTSSPSKHARSTSSFEASSQASVHAFVDDSFNSDVEGKIDQFLNKPRIGQRKQSYQDDKYSMSGALSSEVSLPSQRFSTRSITSLASLGSGLPSATPQSDDIHELSASPIPTPAAESVPVPAPLTITKPETMTAARPKMPKRPRQQTQKQSRTVSFNMARQPPGPGVDNFSLQNEDILAELPGSPMPTTGPSAYHSAKESSVSNFRAIGDVLAERLKGAAKSRGVAADEDQGPVAPPRADKQDLRQSVASAPAPNLLVHKPANIHPSVSPTDTNSSEESPTGSGSSFSNPTKAELRSALKSALKPGSSYGGRDLPRSSRPTSKSTSRPQSSHSVVSSPNNQSRSTRSKAQSQPSKNPSTSSETHSQTSKSSSARPMTRYPSLTSTPSCSKSDHGRTLPHSSAFSPNAPPSSPSEAANPLDPDTIPSSAPLSVSIPFREFLARREASLAGMKRTSISGDAGSAEAAAALPAATAEIAPSLSHSVSNSSRYSCRHSIASGKSSLHYYPKVTSAPLQLVGGG